MATSNSNDSYTSQKVSFSNVLQARGTASGQDARLVNCFIERLADNNNVVSDSIVSRGGLQYHYTSTGGFFQRGITYFQGSIYTVTNNRVLKDGVPIGPALTTSITEVGFVEFFTSTNQFILVLLDGVSGYTITPAGVMTKITDIDFPTPHNIRAVFMDGYLFVTKAGTGDVYNSQLDDPTAWTPGDFITAEMYPDTVGPLMRQGNYLVAFGEYTMEYFYNAGNFPGSPLARNDSAFHKVGVAAPNSIATMEDNLIFVGNPAVGGRTIYLLNNFKLVEIATDPVRRLLEGEGSGLQAAIGFIVRHKGHHLYVLNLLQVRRTLVYDLLQNTWSEWTNAAGTDLFSCDFAVDHPNGRAYLLARVTGDVVSLNQDIATDTDGLGQVTPILITATSNRVDFGNMNRKFANRFTLVCNSVPSPATISLAWSDDDYKTWSSERTMSISDTMTTIQQLGCFRRRAWRLTYQQPYPLRVDGAEVTINMGTA